MELIMLPCGGIAGAGIEQVVEARRRRQGSKEDRRFEEVERILSAIRHLDNDSCILVEGQRDREGLRALGILGKVSCLQCGIGSISERLERLDAKKVIIMMDFDPEGGHLAKLVYRLLAARGRRVDLTTWRTLKSYIRRDVRDVEGLAAYVLRRSN